MKKLTLAAIVALSVAPLALPTEAMARKHYDENGRYYDNNGRVYHGRDSRYSYRCKRSSGTTGTIAGGVGGAVIGNVLGGGTLGTLAGAGGGALLGRHLDKKHDAAQNRKNGC